MVKARENKPADQTIRGLFSKREAVKIPPAPVMPLGKRHSYTIPYGTGTAVLFERSLRLSNSTASEKAIEK